MVIEKDKVVSLIYELRVDGTSGEIIESLKEDKPLTFIYGTGALLSKFEDNINGLKSGDAFSFLLQCGDAYGLGTEEAVVEIPKQVFEVEGEFDKELVSVGNAIPMMDGEGNRLNGVVVSVNTESVTMDFNHPLAGDNLHFTGKIVGIRDATSEELQHGHLHSASNCGSCCDSDKGDCGSDCNTDKSGCCEGH
jgi:FKBP-type peptidyl-prolyl cis-trans isomerase SlyD